EAGRVAIHEIGPDHEGLGQSLGAGLRRILDGDAQPRSIAEELLETREVPRRRYDEDLAESGKQQSRQRVVDPGLVVDREQSLAPHAGGGVQAGAGSPGEYDALQGDLR